MPDGSRAWIGSGFLYAYLQRADLKGESRYGSYIVTNRHVLVSLKEVLVRFNPGSLSPETAAEIVAVRLVDDDGKRLWQTPIDGVRREARRCKTKVLPPQKPHYEA
jgi:hypothetical protein